MKRLIILFLQAALVAAIVGGTYIYTESRTKPTGVLVFSRNIPRYTKITEGMVAVVTVPDSAVSREMGRDVKDILGKYTGADVIEGEPVFTAKLLQEKSVAPEYLLRGDMRKQSFEVDLAGSNGGALKPGDYVDLIYYVEDNAANIARSDIFIRKIPVLDVRNSEAVSLNGQGNSAGEGEFNSGAGKRIPAVITVAVTPEQSKQIVFYKNRGEIDIAVYLDNAPGSGNPPNGQQAGLMTGTSTVGALPAAKAGLPVRTAPGEKTATTAAAASAAVKRSVPDYRSSPNVVMPGKVDNGRNR